MKTSYALFDVDGVLALPEEIFSIVYSRSRGLDPAVFEAFFRNDWRPIVTGEKDLKESIAENPQLWRWDGGIDDLLAFWFKTEDVRNEELVEIIREARNSGVRCYLATDQEKYRAAYMKEVMFKDLVDGFFVSCEVGLTKTDPGFFECVVAQLRMQSPNITPEEIVFFDDSQSKIDVARSVGINGLLYLGTDQVKEVLGW